MMAVQFFTEKARMKKERKVAEIQANTDNPQSPLLVSSISRRSMRRARLRLKK